MLIYQRAFMSTHKIQVCVENGVTKIWMRGMPDSIVVSENNSVDITVKSSSPEPMIIELEGRRT